MNAQTVRMHKCRRPGSNWRPFACEANVITNYTTTTLSVDGCNCLRGIVYITQSNNMRMGSLEGKAEGLEKHAY